MAKRIVLTGGGTAGHVTPHLAILPYLKKEGYDIHYIGTENGIEHSMMAQYDFITYHAVKSGKLRRYFDVKNFTDPFRVIQGAFQSYKIIKKLKPDVCFSKGGFVSVPVVFAAHQNKVPVLCHESDLTPGLANKICAKFAKKIATTFPECAQSLGAKAEMTGTPLRETLFLGNKQKGLEITGFSQNKPVLLMTGGSLGAQSINKVLRESLPLLLEKMQVVHLCGKGNKDTSLEHQKGYVQYEFMTDDLPHIFACADLVLSRAGSNSLCELQALKKPMLLIPYPKTASRGDQILNAQSFEKRGLAHILYQEDMNKETLTNALFALLKDKDILIDALTKAPPADGTKRILELIEEIQTN